LILGGLSANVSYAVNQLNVGGSAYFISSFTANNRVQALPELDSSPARELAGDILCCWWVYGVVRVLEPGACDTRTGISCYCCVCQQSERERVVRPIKKEDDTDWAMFINSRRNSLITGKPKYIGDAWVQTVQTNGEVSRDARGGGNIDVEICEWDRSSGVGAGDGCRLQW